MLENVAPISITLRAVTEIKKTIATKNIPADYGLRVGIRGGGCGASLIIGFDKKNEHDQEFTISEVRVLVDKRHTLYVFGKEVDFYEGFDARGFIVQDPEPTS